MFQRRGKIVLKQRCTKVEKEVVTKFFNDEKKVVFTVEKKGKS